MGAESIASMPGVKTVRRHPDDEFLVLGSASLWDVVSPQGILDQVTEDLPAIRRGDVLLADVVDRILHDARCRQIWPQCSSTIGKSWDERSITMVLVVFDEEWLGVSETMCALRSSMRPPCRRRTSNVSSTSSESKPKKLVILGNLGSRRCSPWNNGIKALGQYVLYFKFVIQCLGAS
jgi:hypothetical protein